MQEPLYELEMCYMFGKWSKFRSKFKECLERLYETGIILKLTDDAWRLPNKALNADSATVLMFPDLVPVFRFIGYGWLLLGENCLVIMELKPTEDQDMYDLIIAAFTGATDHYLAKYVVVLFYDIKVPQTILKVEHYFDYMNIMSYVIVVQFRDQSNPSIVGYMKQKQLVLLNETVDFATIFKVRLTDQPLRTIVTESKPHSFLSKQWQVVGLDIEIAKLVARMIGVELSVRHVNPLKYAIIPTLLMEKKMDMYLTRRGCNTAVSLPQLRLHEKFNVRVLMPKMQRFNFNLQFLKPYKSEAWYLLLLLLTIAGVFNWVFWKRVRVNILLVIIFGYQQETSRMTALLVLVLQFLKFILLEAYLGQVTSFMIRLRYQESPQTLEQFFASDIMLNAPKVMDEMFIHLPVTVSEQLKKKLKQPRLSVINEIDFYEPGFAYIITEYASDAMQKEVSDESFFNSSFFYIMQEPLHEFDSCYMFGLWSKFSNKFKECLERLYETGITLKLTDDAWRLPNKALNADLSTVLMFSDVVPVLYLLCYGWVLGM
uniref:Solute-binding protein family 3/N-terminal domain-containing protein n=1 Tax=Anopheles quadriannulatus TaxID=34691 RepID=A0A182WTW1_ANOQN